MELEWPIELTEVLWIFINPLHPVSPESRGRETVDQIFENGGHVEPNLYSTIRGHGTVDFELSGVRKLHDWYSITHVGKLVSGAYSCAARSMKSVALTSNAGSGVVSMTRPGPYSSGRGTKAVLNPNAPAARRSPRWAATIMTFS